MFDMHVFSPLKVFAIKKAIRVIEAPHGLNIARLNFNLIINLF